MNSRLSAIIIDDEPEAILSLQILLKNIAEVEVKGSTTEPEKALMLCKQHKPDILFLDIKMPGEDGFEVLEEIYSHNFRPYVIFTTAFDEYALKALKAGAFEYLLKPVDNTELNTVMQKILREKESHSLEKRIEELERSINNHRKLRFNTRSGFILIHPDDIFYIEADANYSEIFLSKEKREIVSMNLGAIEVMLPKQFIRISRSTIINSHYISKISGVNKICYLNKNNEELVFNIPEKQMPEIKRKIGNE